uniref:Cytochrome b5 heme-binding domain-containing protein n=1 Tax=Heterorhabditis bacteriophora TaxID=37862 RepID=A0A1I7WYG6_HETBA
MNTADEVLSFYVLREPVNIIFLSVLMWRRAFYGGQCHKYNRLCQLPHKYEGRSKYDGYNQYRTTYKVIVSASLLAGIFGFDKYPFRIAYSEALKSEFNPPERKDLPTYSKDEVKNHGKSAESVWVTYKGGVYDVTDFVVSHPGGDKIFLAAGGSVEPFWALYAQHKTNEVTFKYILLLFNVDLMCMSNN